MARRRQKGEERELAVRRMDLLLSRAQVERRGPEPALADRYVELAMRLSTRYQTGLTMAHKAQVCRACHALRTPQRTRVRVHSGRLVTTCLACGDVRRRGLVARVATGRDVFNVVGGGDPPSRAMAVPQESAFPIPGPKVSP